ncbi:MAG TPA: hypothetical protein ENF46_01430 [Candidatus Acetothermia bacterium]|mgnify:CR=1 FL=1|nr:hypothetical protein [Candidatus Acetothermia bacterium]
MRTEENRLSTWHSPDHWGADPLHQPFERVLWELGRRGNVARIFPNPRAAPRQVVAVSAEQQDEWEAVLQLGLHGHPPRDTKWSGNPIEAVEEMLAGQFKL